jgi:ornithine cyclodeaminase
VLVLNAAEVESVLDRDALTDAIADALSESSAGRASVPPRVAAEATGGGLLAAMPGFLPGLGALGAKLVTVFPGNTDRPTHQAVVVLFEPSTGTPIAFIDGTMLTAARTAAASAVATRCLARDDAEVMAILGTGVQARAHAHAVPGVCGALREIRIAGRDERKSETMAIALSDELERTVIAAPTFAAALADADIVCATTHSPDPVVRREWLRAGAHVNSVGFNTAGREVDAQTVLDSLVVVESRNSALAPVPAGANELLWPIRDGLMEPSHVYAELGELVAGTKPGRTSPEQLTLYKSVGVAVEDLAAAMLVVTAAQAQGVGAIVDV